MPASLVPSPPRFPRANRNVAPFLSKLFIMVNDPTTNELIRWSNDGTSFIVTRPTELAKRILPQFFKHDHFSSFVRQLNTYGFHKVPQLQQGVLRPDNNAGMDLIEFANPRFRRDQPDLLLLVQRKRSSNSANKQKGKKASSSSSTSTSSAAPTTANTSAITPTASASSSPVPSTFSTTSSPTLSASSASLPPTPTLASSIPSIATASSFPSSPLQHAHHLHHLQEPQQQQQQQQKSTFSDSDVHRILDEMSAIKSHQLSISNELKQMQGNNQVLWQEILTARERNHQHQDTINKILRFLASVYTSSSTSTPTLPTTASSTSHAGPSLGAKKQPLMIGVEQAKISPVPSPCPSSVSLPSGSTSPVFDLNDLVEVPQTMDQEQLQSSLCHLTQMSQHDVFWNPMTGTSTATTLLPEVTNQIQSLGNAASSINQNIDQLGNSVDALAQQMGIHHHSAQQGMTSVPNITNNANDEGVFWDSVLWEQPTE
ncbi:hypothetical protein BDA99DRAFT_494715 [Phascolomyces articulosus]|uniref:HSF-type DNA-binding domain-containing protein n=1 Tax=Phascolomyces articulosus TaxID=60185 RepID=A0AAD5PJW0_9FUNG|nr:hypothetical protein BDA99DRAFT_494715 [Phascolomyces articulosus]